MGGGCTGCRDANRARGRREPCGRMREGKCVQLDGSTGKANWRGWTHKLNPKRSELSRQGFLGGRIYQRGGFPRWKDDGR